MRDFQLQYKMVDYTNLSLSQQLIMLAIVLGTHLIALPLAIKLKKQCRSFIYILFGASITASAMYHSTQIFNVEILMNYGSWHRLDNIFVITGIQTFILIISGYYFQSAWLKEFPLFSNIILQRIAPWDVRFAALPIVLYVMICFGLRIGNMIKCRGKSLFFQEKSVITYNWIYAGISLVFIAIAIFFYYLGLDDRKDYLRIYHNVWHCFGWFFLFFGLKAVNITPKNITKQEDHVVVLSDLSKNEIQN